MLMEKTMSESAPIKIRITEVGPRDGLQNEPNIVSTSQKISLVNALSAAGIPEIETSSFVSPKWVPQLADAEEVFAGIKRRSGTVYSALVPNIRGMDRALSAGVMKIAIFIEPNYKLNINLPISIEEMLDKLGQFQEIKFEHNYLENGSQMLKIGGRILNSELIQINESNSKYVDDLGVSNPEFPNGLYGLVVSIIMSILIKSSEI